VWLTFDQKKSSARRTVFMGLGATFEVPLERDIPDLQAGLAVLKVEGCGIRTK
jgi:hypothetical protein